MRSDIPCETIPKQPWGIVFHSEKQVLASEAFI